MAMLIWGRGAVTLAPEGGTYKLHIDSANFDGVVDGVERLLKHLNYYRAVRRPDQVREFFGALAAFDDFWLDVRKKVLEWRRPRGICCGALLVKTADGYTLARASEGPPTPYDTAASIAGNIRLASEVCSTNHCSELCSIRLREVN
jgi:hypothetical protein